MTRWGSFEAASRVEEKGRPPTSHNDLLGSLEAASRVEGIGNPPTSHKDSLGAV